MEKESTNQLRLGLNKIEEKSCNFADAVVLEKEIPVNTLQYCYCTNSEINIASDSIIISASIKYFSSSVTYVDFTVALSFYVENLEQIVVYKEDSKEISFRSDILPAFLNITCGTVRGMLAEKVKNNSLSKYPVPLLSLEILMKNNHIIVKNK